MGFVRREFVIVIRSFGSSLVLLKEKEDLLKWPFLVFPTRKKIKADRILKYVWSDHILKIIRFDNTKKAPWEA